MNIEQLKSTLMQFWNKNKILTALVITFPGITKMEEEPDQQTRQSCTYLQVCQSFSQILEVLRLANGVFNFDAAAGLAAH